MSEIKPSSIQPFPEPLQGSPYAGQVIQKGPQKASDIINKTNIVLNKAFEHKLVQENEIPHALGPNSVKTLQESLNKLEKAKDHAIRNKAWGVVKGALMTSLVATGVILTLGATGLSTPVALTAGLLSFFVYYALVALEIKKKIANDEKIKVTDLVTTPINVVVDGFTAVLKQEKKTANQIREIDKKCGHFIRFFNNNANELKNFFEKNIENNKKILNNSLKKIKEIESSDSYSGKVSKERAIQKSAFELSKGLVEDYTNSLAILDEIVAFYRELENVRN